MGNQILTFVANHWPLCLAFAGVLALIFLNEHIIQKQGPKALSTDEAVHAINRENATVIDMRDAEPFKQGHITGAKNIPGAPESKLDKYKNKPFILVCTRGIQAQQLATKLRKTGFEHVMILTGGITAWKAANLPLTKGKK